MSCWFRYASSEKVVKGGNSREESLGGHKEGPVRSRFARIAGEGSGGGGGDGISEESKAMRIILPRGSSSVSSCITSGTSSVGGKETLFIEEKGWFASPNAGGLFIAQPNCFRVVLGVLVVPEFIGYFKQKVSVFKQESVG